MTSALRCQPQPRNIAGGHKEAENKVAGASLLAPVRSDRASRRETLSTSRTPDELHSELQGTAAMALAAYPPTAPSAGRRIVLIMCNSFRRVSG